MATKAEIQKKISKITNDMSSLKKQIHSNDMKYRDVQQDLREAAKFLASMKKQNASAADMATAKQRYNDAADTVANREDNMKSYKKKYTDLSIALEKARSELRKADAET